LAIAAMKEIGIDISSQRSKGLGEFKDQAFDYVITLCSQAEEACPVFFGGTQKLHMGFWDPATAVGNDQEKIPGFRKVRDLVRDQIVEVLAKRETS
jgi:arsenate reductase